jgi:hypothetical protein
VFPARRRWELARPPRVNINKNLNDPSLDNLFAIAGFEALDPEYRGFVYDKYRSALKYDFTQRLPLWGFVRHEREGISGNHLTSWPMPHITDMWKHPDSGLEACIDYLTGADGRHAATSVIGSGSRRTNEPDFKAEIPPPSESPYTGSMVEVPKKVEVTGGLRNSRHFKAPQAEPTAATASRAPKASVASTHLRSMSEQPQYQYIGAQVSRCFLSIKVDRTACSDST